MATMTRTKAARLCKLPAYGPGPSLFTDHAKSIRCEGTHATAELIRKTTQAWAKHAAAGEYPVIVNGEYVAGQGYRQVVEWRKAAA